MARRALRRVPPGARAFALHPEHYDFSHQWCPRSASFDRMSTRFTDDGVEVTLVLAAWGGAPPEFVLRYRGATRVVSDGDHDGRPRSGLLVDEILPHADGVSHELAFTGGTITVVARDFTAGWRGKAGPDSPVEGVDSSQSMNLATLVWHLRHRRRMFVGDGSFATLAAYLDGFDWAGLRLLHVEFSRWLAERRGVAGPNIVWHAHIEREVVGHDHDAVCSRDLTPERDAAACELALDLIEAYLAEQGYVAS